MLSLMLAGCATVLKRAALKPEQASPETRALLDLIPAETAKQREELGAKLRTFGDAGILELCAMVVERGKGDDAKARKALYAMAIQFAAPGFEDRRAAYARVLAESLRSRAPREVNAFLISLLRLAGSKESIEALGRALPDKELCDDASQALLSIHRDVAPAFRNALPKAKDACLATVIGALGDLRDQPSVSRLERYARNENPDVRLATLRALANIGDPSSSAILKEAVEAKSPYERSQASRFLILYAQRLAENGRRQEAGQLCRDLLKSRAATGESQVVADALRALVGIEPDTAFGDLCEAMQSKDAMIRGAATDIALAIKGEGVTARWIGAMGKASSAGRVAILTLLAARNDRAALLAAREALRDADTAVRLAAIGAAAKLGGAEAAPDLIALLASANEEERQGVKKALVAIPGAEASAAVARAMGGAGDEARVVLLDVLAQRRALEHLNAIMAQTRSGNESVRIAAVGAVGELAGERELPALVKLLVTTKSNAEREAAEKAVGAVCRRIDNKEKSAAPLLAALSSAKSTPARCSLLRTLGQVGGDKALKAARGAARDKNPEIKDAAVRSLAGWPDVEAANDLLDLARKSPDEIHGILALRGYFRVVGLPAKRPAKQTLEMIQNGMSATTRAEERKMALGEVGAVKDVAALTVAENYLGDAALQEEAVAATIKVARAVASSHPKEARAALDEVLACRANDEATSKQVQEVLDAIKQGEDLIPEWEVAGPYMQDGKGPKELFDIAFPPEAPGAKGVEWKTVKTGNNAEKPRLVDLGEAIGGDDRVAYLRTSIWSPKAQKARLEMGSDDGLKMWLNGEVVHQVNKPRSFRMAEDKVAVKLKKDGNELLLKVTNGGGDWAASARLRAPDGKPLDGIRVQAKKD